MNDFELRVLAENKAQWGLQTNFFGKIRLFALAEIFLCRYLPVSWKMNFSKIFQNFAKIEKLVNFITARFTIRSYCMVAHWKLPVFFFK